MLNYVFMLLNKLVNIFPSLNYREVIIFKNWILMIMADIY